MAILSRARRHVGCVTEPGQREEHGRQCSKCSAALVEAVGRLADKAIDRVLLTDERITSAAAGKRLLAGEEDVEALAGDIQRSSCSPCPSSADWFAAPA